jgi:hypothetical protein
MQRLYKLYYETVSTILSAAAASVFYEQPSLLRPAPVVPFEGGNELVGDGVSAVESYATAGAILESWRV